MSGGAALQSRAARTAMLALVLTLAACTVDPLSPYYPTDYQRQLQAWLGPLYVRTEPPVYCYATLADPDCYAAPVAGWERRLISYYGPPPYDVAVLRPADRKEP